MTRQEIFADIGKLSSGKQTDREDSDVVDKLTHEVPHGNLVDRIFQATTYYGVRGLPLAVRVDGAIVEAIEFMQRLAASKPLPEIYRIKLFRSEPAMTRGDMARAIADLQSDRFDVDERNERLWRLVDDFPHAEIGDLIHRDTQGLTPEQVVDEAIRRQIAHLRSLFAEGDPRRHG